MTMNGNSRNSSPCRSLSLKPLNVILLDDAVKDLELVINKQGFVVYQNLLEDPYYNPGIEETALIISSKHIDMSSPQGQKMLHFFKQGGNVLCPVKDYLCLKSVRGICCHKSDDHSRFWVKQSAKWISFNHTSSLTKKAFKIHFGDFCTNNTDDKKDHTGETIVLTHGILFSNQSVDFISDKTVQQTNLLLEFYSDDQSIESKNNHLPIRVHQNNEKSKYFNWEQYTSYLKTKVIGKSVIHVEVVNSTFDLLEGPRILKNGLAVIADRQIKGRGRGQNQWISPKGCAMTSFQLEYSLNSAIGQKASLLQHLVALSVVDSLKDFVELNLKWPNDIYYGSKIKMGGVVILSSIMKDQIIFNIGLGFNLDNKEPTLSFNALLNSEGMPPISKEIYFAKVFNTLEMFIGLLENGDEGLQKFLKIYHEFWLHQDQEVMLKNENGAKESGIVKNIDSDGFLVVELHQSGDRVAVQPGNNSFDMMQGLILPKKH